MLVLSRKVGEGFLIGDDIVIKVIDTKGGAIRIGIEAPLDKKIYRQEIYDKIRQENVDAARWDSVDLDALSGSVKKRT